jgi:hypothetical protein
MASSLISHICSVSYILKLIRLHVEFRESEIVFTIEELYNPLKEYFRGWLEHLTLQVELTSILCRTYGLTGL